MFLVYYFIMFDGDILYYTLKEGIKGINKFDYKPLFY